MALFTFFLVIGIGLAVLELFVPGGILGIASGVAFLAAAATAYVVFGRPVGHYVVGGIAGSALVFVWWSLRVFPHTRMARVIVATESIGKPSHDLDGMIGKQGVTLTPLRPSGTAEIAGETMEVLAEGRFVARGTPVRVERVSGGRLIVDTVAAEAFGDARDQKES